VIDTSGVPDRPETIAGGSEVAIASKGMVVLQALAAANEAPTPGHAAADVPTIAPVPVAMRAESGSTALPAEAPVPPVEHREPDEPQSTDAAGVSAPAKPAARARRPKKK
jgi:hypothetical protein